MLKIRKKLMDCLRSMACPHCQRNYDVTLPLSISGLLEGFFCFIAVPMIF